MAFHGGVSERKKWSERGTRVKMSSCGAEQVLEIWETPNEVGWPHWLQEWSGGHKQDLGEAQHCSQWPWATGAGSGAASPRARAGGPGAPEAGARCVWPDTHETSPQLHACCTLLLWPLANKGVVSSHGTEEVVRRLQWGCQERERWSGSSFAPHQLLCHLSSFPYILLLQRQHLSQCPYQLHELCWWL